MARKPSQKLVRFKMAADGEIVSLLKQLAPVGDDAVLSSLIGWRDGRGNPRRARGVYDNGWMVELFFTQPRDGKIRLSSYRVNWRGEIKGKAA